MFGNNFYFLNNILKLHVPNISIQKHSDNFFSIDLDFLERYKRPEFQSLIYDLQRIV